MTIGKITLRELVRFCRRSEVGGSLVETALTAPILLTLILGAAELARVAYTAIEVTSAARAGVSYGAQSGLTAGDTTGITWAAKNDAPNVSSLTVSTPVIGYICSDGNASTGATTDCSTSHIEETLTVQTQATMDPIIHLPGLPTSYTLYGQAVQKCLQ